jgi:uncharacterized cupredoxin-like copper-binding protein
MALLSVGAAAGCSRGEAAPRGTVISVVMRDFTLRASVGKVHAGLVTFRVHNLGPSTHEFVVNRTDEAAAALPLRPNGLAVNEDSKLLHPVDELVDVRLGAIRELTLRLKPGHYAFYCNLSGHYRGGMYGALQVAA